MKAGRHADVEVPTASAFMVAKERFGPISFSVGNSVDRYFDGPPCGKGEQTFIRHLLDHRTSGLALFRLHFPINLATIAYDGAKML